MQPQATVCAGAARFLFGSVEIIPHRDTAELLLLAGCLHSQMASHGLSFSDKEILTQIENAIEQEFSFALHISREDIGQYIQDRL